MNRSQSIPSAGRRRGLTLTELLVVVGIIVLILGLSVPALSVWDSRKREDAINLSVGLLQRVRMTAMTEKRVVGLFCYVRPDDQTQYIWSIERQMMISGDPTSAAMTENRFVLRDAEPFKLPKPMRLAPASVLRQDLDVELHWTPEQLVSNEFRDPADDNVLPHTPNNGPGGPGSQYHRNYFILLFRGDGGVACTERAFIVDPDPADYPTANLVDPRCGSPPTEHPGYRTGLSVTDQSDPVEGFHNMVVDNRCPPGPIYFTCADGVLVYDDEAFREATAGFDPFIDPDLPRRFLREQAQPLFIQAQTGAIIQGQPEVPST